MRIRIPCTSFSFAIPCTSQRDRANQPVTRPVAQDSIPLQALNPRDRSYPMPRGADLDKVRQAVAIRKGQQAREQVSVKTIDQGVVAVSVKLPRQELHRLGYKGMHDPSGPAALQALEKPPLLQYLSLDPSQFKGRVAGGEQRYPAGQMTGAELQKALAGESWQLKAAAYINGGFFNFGDGADPSVPDHSSIGETVIPGSTLPPHLPVAQAYAEDFSKLEFENGSAVTVGPTLAKNGKVVFDQDKARDLKYQYDKPTHRPGMLDIAGPRNPRSGISRPADATTNEQSHEQSHKQDRVRLAVVQGLNRGEGMRMSEWAEILAKLDRANVHPGESKNLDGGMSSCLVYVDAQGVERFRGQKQSVVATAVNFIAHEREAPESQPGPSESE
jgi:hypothetical protein